jgi:hypothetical protein
MGKSRDSTIVSRHAICSFRWSRSKAARALINHTTSPQDCSDHAAPRQRHQHWRTGAQAIPSLAEVGHRLRRKDGQVVPGQARPAGLEMLPASHSKPPKTQLVRTLVPDVLRLHDTLEAQKGRQVPRTPCTGWSRKGTDWVSLPSYSHSILLLSFASLMLMAIGT